MHFSRSINILDFLSAIGVVICGFAVGHAIAILAAPELRDLLVRPFTLVFVSLIISFICIFNYEKAGNPKQVYQYSVLIFCIDAIIIVALTFFV